MIVTIWSNECYFARCLGIRYPLYNCGASVLEKYCQLFCTFCTLSVEKHVTTWVEYHWGF